MAIVEMWTLPIETAPNIDLTGFKVEASDGEIGKVDEATREVGGSFLRYHDQAYRNELGSYYNRGSMPPQPAASSPAL